MENDNPGALHVHTALCLLILSIAIAALDYTGYIDVPNWLAALPVGYAWAHSAIYRLIVGANVKALQVYEGEIALQDEFAKQKKLSDAVTLNADSMLRSLRADDEQVGRA